MNKNTEINSYKDLDVWKQSMQLSKNVYRLADELPPEEKYGLSSQLKRASVSIPSNIAEGSRRSSRDFRRFIKMALGSASELETQLLLAEELHGAEVRDSIELLQDIHKMLLALKGSLPDK